MEEVKSNVESVAVRDARQGFGSQGIGSLRGFLARVGIITSIVLVLLLLWYAVDVLLLVFAGVLLAVFLRGLSDGVSRYARLSEGWSLAAVIITIMLTTSGLVWWLAPSVAAQADELRRTLPESINQSSRSVAHAVRLGATTRRAFADVRGSIARPFGHILARHGCFLFDLKRARQLRHHSLRRHLSRG
jgi:predicted PurR-regulated permease PerM